MGIEKLIRRDIASFTGYSAATSPEVLDGKIDVAVKDIIKLDANENPYGCSPRVQKALAKYKDFNIYPDDGQEKLRGLLAAYTGVSANHIVATSGSNTLIDLIERLFIEPGDEVINLTPTFGVYNFSTKLNSGKLVEIPRDKDFNIDLLKVIAVLTKNTKLIFIANPNNPTGNLTSRHDIEVLCKTGIPVVLDEAYYEFSWETAIGMMKKYDNLMILRTFSKWAGLAGLRVGYGMFPTRIAELLLKIKMPYNVNVAALIAVEESLKDTEFLNASVNKIVAERDRLFEQLKTIPWLKPYPSRANFILCDVLPGDAHGLYQRLQEKGILVRYFEQPRLKECIRISVGKPEQTDAIMKVLLSLKPKK